MNQNASSSLFHARARRYIYSFASARLLGALIPVSLAAGLAAAQSAPAPSPAAPTPAQLEIQKIQDALRRRDLSSVPSVDSEQDPNARAWAVRAIARLDQRNGLDALESALQDPAPEVRLAAADELGRKGGARAVNDLVSAISGEKSPGVRQTMAFWLGTSGSAAAVTALGQVLASDPNPNVRAEAAQGLRRQGTASALSALKQGRSDQDARVRQIANE